MIVLWVPPPWKAMPPAYVVTVVATATHADRLVNIWMHKFDLITSEQYSLSY